MCVCYLYLGAPLRRPPVHQPQHVQPHVVLAAAPQREAEAGGPSLQIHAVEPGLVLQQNHRGSEDVHRSSASPVLTSELVLSTHLATPLWLLAPPTLTGCF